MAVDAHDQPVHPLRSRARVLLTSVFGPYAQDDQYGSRVINPMELCHNQVTRVQHAFSFRAFFRSWGLMLLQVNLKAPCTLLDFPTEERFVEEIKTRQYDVIGISSIIPNVLKVRRMCRLIRKHQPEAVIVVGGHVANVPDLEEWVDADHVVRGEGVRWMRPLSRRGRGPADPASADRYHVCPASWACRCAITGPRRCHRDSLGGMPQGVQFLLHLGHVRRQGEVHRVLQDRRRAVRHHVPPWSRSCTSAASSSWTRTSSWTAGGPCELLGLMERHGKPWRLKIFGSVDVLRRYSHG